MRRGKHFNNVEKRPNRSKLRLSAVLVFLGILIVTGIVLFVLFFSGNSDGDDPVGDLRVFIEDMAVTVPWNAGGMADLIVRALTGSEVENRSGSNGAVGINEVYSSPLEGKKILGTNLSSVITSRLTGFTETGVAEWEYWFVAFSPCVIAVRSDSEFNSLEDLISAPELICANAGGGTMSYVAAHLFAELNSIALTHQDYPGVNPAANDVFGGLADFIIAPRSDMVAFLSTGRLREIEAGTVFAPYFGEWYGFMLPKGTQEDVLHFYDELWSEASAGEGFASFTSENGLVSRQPDRETGIETATIMAELIERVLLGSGYLRR